MDNQTSHWTNCLDMIRLTIDMRIIKKKKMQLFSNKKIFDMEHLLSPNATANRICPKVIVWLLRTTRNVSNKVQNSYGGCKIVLQSTQ